MDKLEMNKNKGKLGNLNLKRQWDGMLLRLQDKFAQDLAGRSEA